MRYTKTGHYLHKKSTIFIIEFCYKFLGNGIVAMCINHYNSPSASFLTIA
jgi:hypothetical protein